MQASPKPSIGLPPSDYGRNSSLPSKARGPLGVADMPSAFFTTQIAEKPKLMSAPILALLLLMLLHRLAPLRIVLPFERLLAAGKRG
jgi:hypothetical protein